MRKKAILRNISYSFFANGISLLISVFMVLVIPKFISVYDYGIWQLFLFYFTYLGFFPLGLVDGCLLYTSPSPRDGLLSRMPSSA